jgi:hypothetical protein
MDNPENPPAPDPSPSTPPPPPSPPETKSTGRRKGKIGRLPKATRDRVNEMIQDGVPYLQIIERLGPEGQGLNEVNLTNWKSGGYIDWLKEMQIAEAIQAKYELAESIVARSGEGNAAGQAVLGVIAANLCEFLADTDPATLRESLLSDADKFTRFVNSMVRLAEGGIKCELHKYHHQDRVAEVAKQQGKTETPGVSDQTLETAEEKLKLF